MVELTRKVQRSGNIGMRVEMDKSKKEATLLTFPRRHSSAELKAQTAEIGRLLRLEPNANDYRVAFGMAAGGGTDIDMATRSLVQIMVELADTVDVPLAHIDDRSAYPSLPRTAGVKPLMHVDSGAARPTDGVRSRAIPRLVVLDRPSRPAFQAHVLVPAAQRDPGGALQDRSPRRRKKSPRRLATPSSARTA